jgi:quinol monooxygenase YgiN
MIVLIAQYYVKPGQADAVEAALQEMAPLVRAHEPGCLLYQANRSRENHDHFLLVEHYRDEAALEAHRQTPHFQRLIEGTCIPLLERRARELYDLVAG